MATISEVVIVGAGQAGLQVAASLRGEGYEGNIRLIGEELNLPYQRPPLSKAFLKQEATAASVRLRPLEFYDEQQIDLVTGCRIASIDPFARRLTDEYGQSVRYDRLVLATGVRPRKLGVPGAALGSVFYLRSIADADQLLAAIANARSIAIVGGGFIGLEAAACFAAIGKSVTVLEGGPRVMGRAIAAPTSEFFERYHASLGVNIITNASVAAISGDTQVRSVELVDGRSIPCDLVLVGIGALPNTELADMAGVACEDGIVVNAFCRTSDPHIYAVGDCTRFASPFAARPVRIESVQNAIDQAKNAAANLLGIQKFYDAVPWFWSDQGRMKLQTTGLPRPSSDFVTRGDYNAGKFSVFHLWDGKIIAVDSVNSPVEHMLSRKLVASRARASATELADPDFNLKSLLTPVTI